MGEKAKEERAFPYFPFGHSFHCRVLFDFHNVLFDMCLCHLLIDCDVLCVVIRLIKQRIENKYFCYQTNFLKERKKKRYSFPPFLSLLLSSPLHPPVVPTLSGLHCLSSRCRGGHQSHHTHHFSVVCVWRRRDRFRGIHPLWWMSSSSVQ